jgi:regulator of nucleoside diphosphate kinase
MRVQPIDLSVKDFEKITNLLQRIRPSDIYKQKCLEKLRAEIERARIIPPQDIAPNVVTLHTTVLLIDEQTGKELIYMLVLPEEADPQEGTISVLSPIGICMLGARIGDWFSTDTAEGYRTLRLIKVLYQPEAAYIYE